MVSYLYIGVMELLCLSVVEQDCESGINGLWATGYSPMYIHLHVHVYLYSVNYEQHELLVSYIYIYILLYTCMLIEWR